MAAVVATAPLPDGPKPASYTGARRPLSSKLRDQSLANQMMMEATRAAAVSVAAANTIPSSSANDVPVTPSRDRRLASSLSSPSLADPTGAATVAEPLPSLTRATSSHSLRLFKYRGMSAQGPEEPRAIRKQATDRFYKFMEAAKEDLHELVTELRDDGDLDSESLESLKNLEEIGVEFENKIRSVKEAKAAMALEDAKKRPKTKLETVRLSSQDINVLQALERSLRQNTSNNSRSSTTAAAATPSSMISSLDASTHRSVSSFIEQRTLDQRRKQYQNFMHEREERYTKEKAATEAKAHADAQRLSREERKARQDAEALAAQRRAADAENEAKAAKELEAQRKRDKETEERYLRALELQQIREEQEEQMRLDAEARDRREAYLARQRQRQAEDAERERVMAAQRAKEEADARWLAQEQEREAMERKRRAEEPPAVEEPPSPEPLPVESPPRSARPSSSHEDQMSEYLISSPLRAGQLEPMTMSGPPSRPASHSGLPIASVPPPVLSSHPSHPSSTSHMHASPARRTAPAGAVAAATAARVRKEPTPHMSFAVQSDAATTGLNPRFQRARAMAARRK